MDSYNDSGYWQYCDNDCLAINGPDEAAIIA